MGGYVYDSGAKKLRFKVKESLNSTGNLDLLMLFQEVTENRYQNEFTKLILKKGSQLKQAIGFFGGIPTVRDG